MYLAPDGVSQVFILPNPLFPARRSKKHYGNTFLTPESGSMLSNNDKETCTRSQFNQAPDILGKTDIKTRQTTKVTGEFQSLPQT